FLAAQIQLLDAARFGATVPLAQSQAHDARQRLLGIIELILQLAATIAFLACVYRFNRNARALGAPGMTYSPASSVVWFFVPLANLLVPYHVLEEIWQASSPSTGAHWREAPGPPLVTTWWALRFARGVIHYSPLSIVTGGRMLAETSSLDVLCEFSWGMLIAEVVSIAST